MKKILLGLIALCMLFPAFAQDKTNMQILTANPWKRRSENIQGYYREYKNNRIYITQYYQNEKYTYNYPFYLSDTIDLEFDHNKIGKNQNGKYIVFLNEKTDITSCYEITHINQLGMTLKSMKVLYGGGGTEVYNKWVYDFRK
ncbi:MAG: hypothetical protein LUF90_10200 [Rikenellaceae bacterium]|nr:hypothetical protein [Rikenellaceae bacterium]